MLIPEPLSGGLVTSRDPSELASGELVRADNGIYLPDDDGINRAPGFALSSTISSAESISGLLALPFDNGTHYLVAQTSAKYWLADAENDGTPFTSASSITSGAQLHGTKLDNRWYVFNGANDNLVLTSAGLFRPHGLRPVDKKLDIATTAMTFALPTTGYYEYWYTEVVKYATGDEVESSYGPTAATILISSTTASPILYLPHSSVNSTATAGSSLYFRLYRSAGTKANSTGTIFPNGYAVADVQLGTTSYIDGGTAAASGPLSPTSAKNLGTVGGQSSAHRWTNATSATSTAVTDYARLTCVSALGTSDEFTLYNFALLPIGNVTGIEISLEARVDSTASAKTSELFVACGVDVTPAGLTTTYVSLENFPATVAFPNGWSPEVRGFRKVSPTTQLTTAFVNYTLGSSADDWLPPENSWKADSVGSSSFSVIVRGSMNKALYTTTATPPTVGDTIDVHSVKVKVYYNGPSSTDFGNPYPAVTLDIGGQTASHSANSRPPKASCGAVFEGSLVTNDVVNPGTLNYMRPGYPDNWPEGAYFLDLETSRPVTMLEVINGRLIVGSNTALYRVNYLPSEEDASINRGRAWEEITNMHGALHPRAVCKYTGQNGREMLAIAGPNGLFATDGYGIANIGADLRWLGPTGLFNVSTPSIAQQLISLSNDPGTQTLKMLLTGGLEYVASYAERHRKPGLKWAGPVRTSINPAGQTKRPLSTVIIGRSNGCYIPVYGYESGTSAGCIYRQDAADTVFQIGYNTLPLSTANQLIVKTRDLYFNEKGGEFQTHGIYLFGYDKGASGADPVATRRSPDATIVAEQLYTNAASVQTSLPSGPTGIATKMAYRPTGSLNSDALNLTITQAGTNNYQLNQAVFSVISNGEEEPRA